MSSSRESNDMIDVGGMLRGALKKWYVFAISVVVCMGLAFLYTRIHQTEYLVKANLVISQDDATSSMGGMGALFGSNALVDDEVFAVSSHTVYKKVAQKLGLDQLHYTRTGFLKTRFQYTGYPVTLQYPHEIPDTLCSTLVFKVKADKEGKADITVKVKRDVVAEVKDARFPVTMKTPYGVFVLEKTPDYPKDENVKTTITLSGYDDAAEFIAKKVLVDIASRKSNVIELEMESADTDYAKAVLNSIIEQYNLRGLQEKNTTNLKTLKFIDSRLELLGQDLLSSESTIESFKKGHGIVDVSSEASYQISKKGQFEAQLITTETQLEIIRMIKDFITDPANKYELVPSSLMGGGEIGSRALDSYNQLLLRRISLLQEVHPGNATLKTLNGQIDALRKNIIESIDRNTESINIKLRDLRAEMGQTQARLGSIPSQERQFRDIMRQQSIKEQLYIFLLKQREETSMLLANAKFKGEIIDEAYAINEPLGLGTIPMLLIAMFLGIAIGAGWLYVKKLLRNKFESREELETLTDVPVLGEMCTDRSGRNLIVTPGRNSSAVELFGLMRTNLQFILSGQDDKVILLTSTISGEGKSFISINLASSLALLGKRVLLIGLDIRNPKLQEYLDLPEAPGFTEYIAGNRYTLRDIIRRNPVSTGLDIITSGPIPPNPAELLNSPKVDAMFAELRTMYDYIVIDSAPVGMVSDTFALNRVSDATVYVTRINYSTMKEVKFFNTIYRDKRLNKMSLVVNGTHTNKGYGYGYGQKDND